MLWYPIPGFPNYAANWDAQIKNIHTERVIKSHGAGRANRSITQSLVQKINLMDDNGDSRKRYVHRLVLAAKLGRELEPWEVCRHMDGNPLNNCMANLEAGCRVNNIIDELELGRTQTSIEQIDLAIKRLTALRETLSA